MILPEIKRIVRFEYLAGRTIQSVEQRMDTIRILFTDGMFGDLEPETTAKTATRQAFTVRKTQVAGTPNQRCGTDMSLRPEFSLQIRCKKVTKRK